MKRNERGITLIALIITVIVLLILAGTAISISINGGNIFNKAATARENWNTAVGEEEREINDLLHILEGMSNTGITMTLKSNSESTGKQVTLTKDNFAEHIGKIVVNYTGPSSVTNTDGTFNVSTTYRLFWIDWDNKYGDGAETIYLKADPTNMKYQLHDSSDNLYVGNSETSKIATLNPLLYAEGVTPPTSTNDNMKAVTWLTDTAKWSGLIASSYSTYTNYIVASPSLEMLMDSYNAHYNLSGNAPDYSEMTTPERRKLFCEYPISSYSGNYGYGVAPNNEGEYDWYTLDVLYCDADIDGVFAVDEETLGERRDYWIASPAPYDNEDLYAAGAGSIWDYACFNAGGGIAFCPVVSLKPDVQL